VEFEAVLRERLGSLSLEQKARLLTGADFWSLHAEPAIGLRRIVLSDGPAGVRGELWDERDPSANIPSPTALAASWDEARVAQVYASRPASAVERPTRWLVGFAGASADPGQEVTVAVTVPARAFARWDAEAHAWTVEPGVFHLTVGRSYGDQRLATDITVD
jgi:hypothetical protein